MIERLLWEHASTDKALLLGTSPTSGGPEAWFPRSQIEVLERGYIRNPNFGAHPGVVENLGPRVRVRIPEWLIERANLPKESEHENCELTR